MSCIDCQGGERRMLLQRLQTAAIAHGYELWWREEAAHLVVLALPTTDSHGTPQELIDTYKEQGQVGLPVPPSRARQARLRDRRSVRPVKNSAGQDSYLIDGAPPFELVFRP